MKSEVKQICKKCGNIELKEKTWLEFTKRIGISALIIIIAVTSIFGLTASYNFVVGEVYDNPDIIISISGMHPLIAEFLVFFQSKQTKDVLSEKALEITKDCEDDYCRAHEVYLYLTEFDYDWGENLNALDIFEEKEGDCDEMSFLLKSMLNTLDISSMLQCTNNHCYAIIKVDGKKIMADVVNSEWEVHE